VDGQLDPSHDTIADDVGCCARTVRRALAALKALGLVMWQCRLVRAGWRVAQTSNAYLLSLSAGTGTGTLPTGPALRCGGQCPANPEDC
jgi:DNA-binding GntR family transcriptional regulator